MGFRFQKRISILPGVRLNLSKSGASMSVGPRGASVNIGKRGIFGNVGIPGTGLSYRERLDKPKRKQAEQAPSARPAPLQLPDKVIAKLISNKVELFDDRDRPLDPSLHSQAMKLMKEDVRKFLGDHEDEQNKPIEALRTLHHDVPSVVSDLASESDSKPSASNYRDHGDYMEALMTWRAEQANQGPSHEALENALLSKLGALSWPAETNIALSLNNGRLLLDVDLPELEDMPSNRWKALISQLSIQPRAMSQKDHAALYLDHVSSLLVRLIGHAMAVSTDIKTVAVSAYTQRTGAIGAMTDEYVATAEIQRSDWNQVNTANMQTIDAHNLLRHLGANMKTDSKGHLLVQQALS